MWNVLRRRLQRKLHIKVELCVRLSVLRSFHVDHVVQNRRFLGMNGFHVKTKNGRFTAAVSRFRQNFKIEHFAPSFGRLRWNIASKGVPYGAERLFSSFDQSYYWFVALSLPLTSSFVKFPIETTTAKALKRHKSHDWLDGEKQSSCACSTHFISFLRKQQSGIVKVLIATRR